MKKMESIICFFDNHESNPGEEEAVATIYREGIRDYVYCDRLIRCARCNELLERQPQVTPPPDEPHFVEVMSRPLVTNRENVYYASCWCGWVGKEYQDRIEASKDKLQHLKRKYLLEEVEEVNGHLGTD